MKRGRIITPILLPICIKSKLKQENPTDFAFGETGKENVGQFMPHNFHEETMLRSCTSSWRLILRKSSDLKCVMQRRYMNNRTRRETRKQRLDQSDVEGTTDMQRWKCPAQNSTTRQQSGRSRRCGATMTSYVPIEINPIPLLMIRYYCSHFRGVFPRLSSNQHQVYWLLIDYKWQFDWPSRSRAPFRSNGGVSKNRSRAYLALDCDGKLLRIALRDVYANPSMR